MSIHVKSSDVLPDSFLTDWTFLSDRKKKTLDKTKSGFGFMGLLAFLSSVKKSAGAKLHFAYSSYLH